VKRRLFAAKTLPVQGEYIEIAAKKLSHFYGKIWNQVLKNHVKTSSM